MSFFSELKRRNVFRVGVAYAVASWLLLQIVDLVLENINAPDWVMQVFMLALAVGFPIVLIAAWALEITPEGIKLQKNVAPEKSIARHTGHQLNRGIIMILSMAIVLLLTDKFRDEIFAEPEPSAETTETPADASGTRESKKSIAVLPFRDMSAARDQGYFGEGIAEELLNALVKIEGLKVASRTSAFSLADENLDIPAIAERLGVAHILEGSVRTAGQQVRVTAQLIDVSQDVHLWSETYDGSLDDIFKIQDEITGKITQAMKIQLGGSEKPPSAGHLTDNAEAYQMYLQGRHLWRQRSGSSLREAIRLFSEAVRLDPGFHRAWSNMAVAHVNLADYDRSTDREEAFEKGLAAADKALEIHPRSTEALIIRANYYEEHCDWAESARLYEKAISFSPEDPTAHHWYAILLSVAGHTSAALEQIQIAREIDPLISAVISIEAQIYQMTGNYDRAEELFRMASSLGIYGGSLYPVGMNYLYEGEIEKGKALVEEGWVGEDPAMAASRRLFLQALTDPEKRQPFEAHLGKADPSKVFLTFDNVELLSILGSPYVFDYLSELECPVLSPALWSDAFREQRNTPAFFELMERANVVAYWREFGWPDDCASLDQSLAECN